VPAALIYLLSVSMTWPGPDVWAKIRVGLSASPVTVIAAVQRTSRLFIFVPPNLSFKKVAELWINGPLKNRNE
jgi:hypothetical protein